MGCRAAAEAEPAGVDGVRLSSAGELPGSMVVTFRSGRLWPSGVSTRTWTLVAPSVTRGVVPTRALVDSPVVESGPSSGIASVSHPLQPAASLTRIRTSTSVALTPALRAQDTPATVKRFSGRSPVRTDTFKVFATAAVARCAPAFGGATAAAAAAALCAAGVVAAETGSMPPIRELTTDGATGRGLALAANDTVGSATKAGVRAMARAAEIRRTMSPEGQQG
ncbi:hypothetical protein [Nostocoides sp. HKS02]|uniref:hypothetical protein n=1 Tax=Nostocoides sp. HKS02 TaxID=1813880 RepID=UPI0012B4BAEC|nr:hypothetical protein [Tetrasphaera sp. HKS02]QGN57664.1 hypothetical protein GKE56_07010 [Tetrasphaera sp. HKS02]